MCEYAVIFKIPAPASLAHCYVQQIKSIVTVTSFLFRGSDASL